MNDNRSVQRCLSLLRAFSRKPRQTLAELSKAVELPHSTVLRFLQTLEREGYVRKDGALWSLGAQMLELGFSALESMGVTDSVQVALKRLADACSGTVNIGKKNRDAVIVLARSTSEAERRKLLIVNLRVGSTLPPESALYRGLDLPADCWAVAHYPDRRHVTIAISLSVGLSLGLSVNIDDFPMPTVEGELLSLMRAERAYIERLMALEPL